MSRQYSMYPDPSEMETLGYAANDIGWPKIMAFVLILLAVLGVGIGIGWRIRSSQHKCPPTNSKKEKKSIEEDS
jgi:hypothetical protein